MSTSLFSDVCSISVVEACSECLGAVLTTRAGADVLAKLEENSYESSDWCYYLEPFKPQKRKKVKLCRFRLRLQCIYTI